MRIAGGMAVRGGGDGLRVLGLEGAVRLGPGTLYGSLGRMIEAGLIRESWRYLSDRFQYKPSVKVPYILYNTYREFLETNVFEVRMVRRASPQGYAAEGGHWTKSPPPKA